MSNIFYEFYTYDDTLYRLTFDAKTADCVRAEGYFTGDGFRPCEAYVVMRKGKAITKNEFQNRVLHQRQMAY